MSFQLSIDFDAEPAQPLRRPAKRSTGKEVGHAMANLSADRADREIASWSEVAMEFLKQFAVTRGTFMAEDVRFAAESCGAVLPPPDGRAWGAVFLRARRNGLIVTNGYAPAESSNGSPKCVWRSA